MTIEIREGLLAAVFHARSLKPFFSGQRGWSPMTDERFLSVSSNNGDTRAEAVSKVGEEDDTLLYERTRQHHLSGTITMEERIIATGDEINDPKQPWHDRIRRVIP